MDINYYGIVLTQSAKDDLNEIYKYISENLKEPKIAHKLMQKIEKSIFNLERLPYIHSEILIRKKKFRRLIINNYITLYRINEKRKQIIIYNVIYGKKDYLK